MIELETVGVILGVLVPLVLMIKRDICKKVDEHIRETKPIIERFIQLEERMSHKSES